MSDPERPDRGGELGRSLETSAALVRNGSGNTTDLSRVVEALLAPEPTIGRRFMAVINRQASSPSTNQLPRATAQTSLHGYAWRRHGIEFGTTSVGPLVLAEAESMLDRGFFAGLDIAGDSSEDAARIDRFFGLFARLGSEGGDTTKKLPPFVKQVIFGLEQYRADRAAVVNGTYRHHRQPRLWEFLKLGPKGVEEYEAARKAALQERARQRNSSNTLYLALLHDPGPLGLPRRYVDAVRNGNPEEVAIAFAVATQWQYLRPENPPYNAIACDGRISRLIEEHVATGLPLLQLQPPPLWLAQLAADQLRSYSPAEKVYTDDDIPYDEDIARTQAAVRRVVAKTFGEDIRYVQRTAQEWMVMTELWLYSIAQNANFPGQVEAQKALMRFADLRLAALFTHGGVQREVLRLPAFAKHHVDRVYAQCVAPRNRGRVH